MCCQTLVKIASFDNVVCGGRVEQVLNGHRCAQGVRQRQGLWNCTRKTFEERASRAEEAGDASEENKRLSTKEDDDQEGYEASELA